MKKFESCPNCSGRRFNKIINSGGNTIKICKRCDALLGEMTRLVESKKYVDGLDDNPKNMNIRYYNFIGMTSEGIARRHGWCDKVTGRIVQVG